MKEKKQIRILLLIVIQMASFCSCQIRKKMIDGYESIDVIIKNNSSGIFYFNLKDIEHPRCGMIYVDDIKRIKEFYFSLSCDIASDITIMPSSFSYKLNPADEIKLNVKLKEDFDGYYKIDFDETSGMISETLIGRSLENRFFIFCSPEPFSYNSHSSDYCEKVSKYGIKLEGKQTGERTIEFVIN